MCFWKKICLVVKKQKNSSKHHKRNKFHKKYSFKYSSANNKPKLLKLNNWNFLTEIRTTEKTYF